MSFVKKAMSNDFVSSIIAFIISVLIRVIYIFSSVEYRGVDKLKNYLKDGKPVIVLFWHGRSFFLSKFWGGKIGIRKHSIYGIFSNHRDGKLIGKVFGFLGVKNIMTSSKSKTQASSVAIKSIRLLKKGVSIGFTPDGPLGPRMNLVSDSSLLFARSTGAPIVPIYVSSKEPKILKSWDRYMIVKPFKKTIIEIDDLFFIDKKITDEDFKSFKKDLTDRMVEKQLKLDKEMGMPVILPDNGKK